LVIETIHKIIEIDNGPLDIFDPILKPLISGAIERRQQSRAVHHD